MLHDLDNTFRELIYLRGNLKKSDVEVVFDQPSGEWSSQIGKPTVNCWCFDVRENIKLRNKDIGRQMNGTRMEMRLPALRYDFTYLITAWASHVADEHQLLWRTLSAFSSIGTLKAEDCEGDLRDQEYDIPLTVAQFGETINNFSELWGVLDNQMHLGFTVTATLALDSKRSFEAPMVFEAAIRIGQSDKPPKGEMENVDLEFKLDASDEQKEDSVFKKAFDSWKQRLDNPDKPSE